MTATIRTGSARRARRGVASAIVGALAVLVLVPAVSAGAQESNDAGGAPVLNIKQVDATGGEIRVEGWLGGHEPSELKLKVDGRNVDPSSVGLNSASGRSSEVMVVLDNAASLGNATVQLSKKALGPLMPGAGVVDSLGVISTGSAPTLEQGLTSSAADVERSLVGVIPDGGSSTWGGVRRAAEMLADRGATVDASVVLFAASPIQDSGMAAATAALRKAGADLHVVGIEAGTDLGLLSAVVADVGGSFRTAANDEALDQSLLDLSTMLGGRFTITAPGSTADSAVKTLSVSAGRTSAEVAFVPGAVRVGSNALAAGNPQSGGISEFFSGALFKWLAILLVVGAAVMLFWGVVSIILPDETNLVQRLEVYEDPYGERPEVTDDGDDGHATVPIIRKAVELTGDLASKRGMTENLEFKLEQANVPLRAAEVMFFVAASAVFLALVAGFLSRNPLLALGAGAIAVVVPQAWLNLRIRRRQKAFVNQLPDMLTLLAGTLRAGYSISQGFESVSTEIRDPMGRELRRVVSEARLGRPLEEALESVGERMQSEDFAWAVMAIRIQREVGGNLAELLLTVAETMTQRERLRREVLTLTAEGRMSAIIIGFLPLALAAALFVMNPTYIKELFSPGLGYALVATALVAMGIGFVWMKKTVTIEV